MRFLLAAGLLVLAAGWPLPAASAPYYNSSEPGCDGSDPNVYFCDDFEDGDWFYLSEQSGQLEPRADGWGAPSNSSPSGAARCGPGVTPFGNCVANGGNHTGGQGGVNMGLHFLRTPTCGTDGTQLCNVPEVYVRWYAYWDPGYQFGNEKNLNVTNNTGDIAFINIQINCDQIVRSTGNIYTQAIHGSDPIWANCGPIGYTIQSGRWYFFEYNVRASNSPAGIGRARLWINDCGTTAAFDCGPAPILRIDRIGDLPGNANGSQIQTIWLENWANPPSIGNGPLWENIRVQGTGPIGFAGATPPVLPGPVTAVNIAFAPDPPVTNPIPTTTSVSPASAIAGGATFTLTVNGTGFVNSSVVRWNSSNRTTGFVSTSQLTATVVASDIATAGTATVTVFSPAPGGGTSNAQTFTVSAAGGTTTTVTFDNPVPPGSSGSFLNGVFQGINFGTNQWAWESAYGPDSTNHVYFGSGTGTSRTFTFSPAPRTLTSIRVFTTAAGTLTLTDNLGQTRTQAITTGSMQLVTTGWAQASTTVTVAFTAGWDLGIDDIVYVGP